MCGIGVAAELGHASALESFPVARQTQTMPGHMLGSSCWAHLVPVRPGQVGREP
jgi:hypothetical protein